MYLHNYHDTNHYIFLYNLMHNLVYNFDMYPSNPSNMSYMQLRNCRHTLDCNQ